MDFDRVLSVLSALEREHVAYKIIGGVAMNFHGLARGTRHLDLFIAPDPENVSRLRKALHSVFDDPSIDEILAEDLVGDYPAIQYVPPVEGFHIDLIARLGEAFGYEQVRAERRTFGGVLVLVATRDMLLEMKQDGAPAGSDGCGMAVGASASTR